MSGCSNSRAVRLFDAHCHLQDRRIAAVCPKLIRASIDSGVLRFAVNGVSEKDWHLVKQMGEQYPCVVPNFGLHPWYVNERTANWFNMLREFLTATPTAAVGEIGLDKGSHGRNIDFSQQVEVFRQQLDLAKELQRPASVHCVRAFGDLLEILQKSKEKKIFFSFRSSFVLPTYSYCYDAKGKGKKINLHIQRRRGKNNLLGRRREKGLAGGRRWRRLTRETRVLLLLLRNAGPFPAGLILHSYLGSAEMVSGFAKLGAYFSFSGYLTSMKSTKAKNMLKLVPKDRILVESDAPDGLPNLKTGSLLAVPADDSSPQGLQSQQGDPFYEASASPKEELNHPANIHTVLHYVATMLQMPDEELAELTYRNATRLFSYNGSKVVEVD